MENNLPLTLRDRLLKTLDFARVAPPRFESEFSDEVVNRWREEGHSAEQFHLDTFEYLPLEWRLERKDRRVVRNRESLELFRDSFESLQANPAPDDWSKKLAEWKKRAYPLAAAPWDEGFFQLLGIRNGATLTDALVLLQEQPALAEAQMEFYAQYLEKVLDELLPDVRIDMAIYYEPIASNHGPVVSPETYRRFVQPAFRRVVQCMKRHGVRHHFIWSAGFVKPLIPLWIESGINGFLLNRGAECGLRYLDLRKEYGSRVRLMGGIDWRAVMEGPDALRREFEASVCPLLEQGGYIPHLDDTVRGYMPFDKFEMYRQMLDEVAGFVDKTLDAD